MGNLLPEILDNQFGSLSLRRTKIKPGAVYEETVTYCFPAMPLVKLV